jgi:pyruvate dehydrogenase E2 component (dihydrolipoamide acetyltransferase)
MAIEKIRIPDFGDVQKITVVEVYIAPGDQIDLEAPLIALESEKAVMDIPSPVAGIVKEVLVKADDMVASGDVIALVETAAAEEKAEESLPEEPPAAEEEIVAVAPSTPVAEADDPPAKILSHATPSVRAYAREQQVDLANISGTGPGGRIVREDVLAALAAGKAQQQGQPAAPQPLEDFGKYGPVEEVGLGRIQKLSGPHLHKSWTTIPHVTHFDQADITELEVFRKRENSNMGEGGVPFSPLVFVVKAVAATLKAFPAMNSSLLPGGEKIILKKYYHLGIAVDTPGGLVVPVVKDVDRKGLREIAGELQRLSSNARAGKSAIPDLQGATFTISSLGGIGGSGFTPIISLPQVAILGLSRSAMQPVWEGQQFVPRLMLPFSLSYDHRVIDGAEAARFCRALRENIEDLRRVLL